LATALFGGFTPAIATGLIELTGNKALPGVWMSFAAAAGLSATLMSRGLRRKSKETAASTEVIAKGQLQLERS
jgi:MHS family citrate/tricarballylate:H+ symporter-like MFS transporter